MIESMTIQVLQVVLLAATQAGREFDASSTVEGWMTGFAMAALIISLILVFYLSANHKRSLDSFRRQIDGLTAHIEQLQQRISELDQQTPTKTPPEESEELIAVQNS